MSLINAVTRRRLDLAQHRNLYLDRLPHLPWSGRYLSDKALRIDKSKLDDVGYSLLSLNALEIFVDDRASQKFILLNRLTLTSISLTKTGKLSLPICATSINENANDE